MRALGVLANDVEGLVRGDAETSALADREEVLAAVRAEDAAAPVHDLTASTRCAVTAQELGTAGACEEAQVLALRPLGDRQTGCARDLPDARLLQLTEREVQTIEDRRRHAGE